MSERAASGGSLVSVGVGVWVGGFGGWAGGLWVVSGSQRLSSATGTETLMNRFPSLHSCAFPNPRANPEQLLTQRRVAT